MAEILHILALFLSLTVFPVLAAQPFKALVAPITQSDPSSSLYTLTLNKHEELVIDIESPLSWHRCPRLFFPRVSCNTRQCLGAQSNRSPFCDLEIAVIPAKPPFCTCFTLPSNRISKSCASSQLTYTNVSISTTNGHIPLAGIITYNKIFMSCAPKSLFLSLPEGSSGVASLSKGSLSLVSQFSAFQTVPKKFGMCLGEKGAAFFGDGPFYLSLPPSEVDVTRLLDFTALVNHPRDPVGYYIVLKGISVNNFKGIPVNGNVKLSTVTPYTTLRSDIYKALLEQFAKATSGSIRRVPKVAPFGLCLNSTGLGSTRVGFNIPQIDLEMKDGATWTIFGANSMKKVSDDVACLAFVDGGEMVEQAVVIGSYQMQHNFLLFDLVNSRLGFSSSLVFSNTTCNNFNFTSGVNKVFHMD